MALAKIEMRPYPSGEPDDEMLQAIFCKATCLSHDGKFSEQLYIDWNIRHPIPCGPPDKVTRQAFEKTNPKIFDDFIAPNATTEAVDAEARGYPNSSSPEAGGTAADTLDLALTMHDILEPIPSIDNTENLEEGQSFSDFKPFETCIGSIHDAFESKTDERTPGIELL